MEPITLTYDKALELLERAVKEKGEDFVYMPPPNGTWPNGTCLYRHEDGPGCIVGHVAYYLGVLEDMREGKAVERGAFEHTTVNLVGDAGKLLAYVQRYQDSGVPWGQSVRSARADCES